MQLQVIAVGTRVPAWVNAGVQDYARRLPRELAFAIAEVKPAVHRSDVSQAIAEEGQRVLQRAGSARLIALDERGESWTTLQLAQLLAQWQHEARDVALLVGGADGHAPAVRAAAHAMWSLSALTLPHALVRVIVAEQLYRASSLLRGHPYHRA